MDEQDRGEAGHTKARRSPRSVRLIVAGSTKHCVNADLGTEVEVDYTTKCLNFPAPELPDQIVVV